MTKHLHGEISPIAVRWKAGRVKRLSIETGSAEEADGLRGALAPFSPEVTERTHETFVVQVDLSSRGHEVGSILHAIQEYVTARQAGPALIDWDGRTYLMEAH
jgi:hypothetical protein